MSRGQQGPDLVAVWGEVVVQFWLKPGEAAVVFEVGNEPPADPIPEELKPFLWADEREGSAS